MSIKSAGGKPVINVFKTGVVLGLISQSNGKNLRIKGDGSVDAKGVETDKESQFKVYVCDPPYVTLQNVNNPDHWLQIKDDKVDGKGAAKYGTDLNAPPTMSYSELKLEQHTHHVTLESMVYTGQHVGIFENGEPMQPKHAFEGHHAQFQPKVIEEVKEIITAGTSEHEMKLAHGNVVILESVQSGKSLRVCDDSKIDACGGSGALAKFISHVDGDNIIKLQCMKHRQWWLNIDQDDILRVGLGGKISKFKVKNSDGNLVLESYCSPGSHVGVNAKGDVRDPSKTGTGKEAQFKIKVIKKQPEYYRAGTSILERALHHGNVIVLTSRISKKALQINENMTVDGSGDPGSEASCFIVHVRSPGVVALQNKNQPEFYLRVTPDQLTTAPGGSRCNFNVTEKDYRLLFECVDYPGMYIEIQPDGHAKAPKDTDVEPSAQFSPIVKIDSLYGRSQ